MAIEYRNNFKNQIPKFLKSSYSQRQARRDIPQIISYIPIIERLIGTTCSCA